MSKCDCNKIVAVISSVTGLLHINDGHIFISCKKKSTELFLWDINNGMQIVTAAKKNPIT